MDKPELLGLLVEALEKARKEGPHSLLRLVPSSENGLLQFSKAHILSELHKLETEDKALELVLPIRRDKDGVIRGHYDFDVGEGRVYWRVVSAGFEGFGPVVTRVPVPDDDLQICVSLLPKFDDWLVAYRLKRQDNLDGLDNVNLGKVYATVRDIHEKLQLEPSTQIIIGTDFRLYSPFLRLTYNAAEYRRQALTYLQDKRVVRQFMELDKGSRILVVIDIPKFQAFKDRVFQVYETRSKTSMQEVKAAVAEKATTESAKGDDILYQVKLTGGREVFLNGLLLTRLDSFGENEAVFRHLYDNPNRAIPIAELEKLRGEEGLKKSLGKIVENLGFTGDLGKAFFDVSKTAILFRNPLRRADLERLGMDYLRLPRRSQPSESLPTKPK